jgi:transposase
LPPRSTVHGYFDLWNWDGTLERVHHALYVKCREKAGRDASPTAAIIDSQSVKSAEKGAQCIKKGASPRLVSSKSSTLTLPKDHSAT